MGCIKCAVLPVAGLGTRFLPATKSVAKELLPVLDRPLLQYAVDECAAAGIEHIVLVTNRLKNSLVDYLERDHNLERILRQTGKEERIEVVKNVLPEQMSLVNVRQPQPGGLGQAILCARPVVGDEPFAVILPDDLLVLEQSGAEPTLQRMVALYEQLQQSIIAVQEVADADVSSYGIVQPGDPLGDDAFSVRGLVEKPLLSQAPSRWGVVGRYVLSPDVFDHLQAQQSAATAAGAELQLTDAIHLMVPDVAAHPIQCQRYDCGSKVGFLQANLAAAAKDQELQPALRRFVADWPQRDPA